MSGRYFVCNFWIWNNLMTLIKSKIMLGLALLSLAGCASKEVDLDASPYSQAAAIKNMGGTYKIGNPYEIMGQTYYPHEDYKYSEVGIASWYGEDFHAKKTANGEDYDMNTLTAAHRTLPLPSIVKVTNLENGRSLILRVNDRGPYAKNRIIDISKRGAQLLGFQSQGTAKVRVEIMPKESIALKQALLDQDFEPDYALYNARSEALSIPPGAEKAPVAASEIAVQTVQPGNDRNYLVGAGAPAATVNLPARPQINVAAGGKKFFVQAGAFSKEDSAQKLSSQLKSVGSVNMTMANVNGRDFYRVRLGPYNSEDEAFAALDKVKNYGIPDARVVRD